MAKKSIIKTVLLYIVIILAVIILVPFIYGPNTKNVRQQAHDAGILLDQQQVNELYRPIPSDDQNAAPELAKLTEEFEDWPDFFDKCQQHGTYQFRYTADRLDLAQESEPYKRYPGPDFAIPNISPESLANLEFYITSQKDLFDRLALTVDKKDRYYSEKFAHWQGIPIPLNPYDESISDMSVINAVAKLLYKQGIFYASSDQPQQAILSISRMYKVASYASAVRQNIWQLIASAVRGLAQYNTVLLLSRGLNPQELSDLELLQTPPTIEDTILRYLVVSEYELDKNEFTDFNPVMEWLFNVKFVKDTNIKSYLRLLIDLKNEVKLRSPQEYCSITEDLGQKYLPGPVNSVKALLNYKVHTTLVSDGRSIELFLRSENINRIIDIAIAQEKYFLANEHFAPDLAALNSAYPDLDIIDLIASKQGSSFIYEQTTEPDGKHGYIIASDFFDELDPDDPDPLQQARDNTGPFWIAGPYRTVLKIVR